MEEQEIIRNWYALKVFYNKVFEIEKDLLAEHLEVYFPVRKEQVKQEALRRVKAGDNKYERIGPRVVMRRIPVVNSLVFVKASEEEIALVRTIVYGRALVYFNAERSGPAVIPDREKAVEYAVNNARRGDVILFAGKGHEDFQLIRGERVPFSERDIIKRASDKIKIKT